jgi:hypothetical protein
VLVLLLLVLLLPLLLLLLLVLVPACLALVQLGLVLWLLLLRRSQAAYSYRCSSGSDGSSGIVGDVSDDHGAFVASLLVQQAISTGECNSKITQLY